MLLRRRFNPFVAATTHDCRVACLPNFQRLEIFRLCSALSKSEKFSDLRCSRQGPRRWHGAAISDLWSLLLGFFLRFACGQPSCSGVGARLSWSSTHFLKIASACL